MARKKVKALIEIDTWDAANEALRLIAVNQSRIDKLVAAHNEREAKYREVLDERCAGLRFTVHSLGETLKDFCIDRRDDFGKKQSKALTNGKVSFHKGQPKTKLLSKFKWDVVVEAVKKSIFGNDFLRVKEEINKEMFIEKWTAKETEEKKAEFNELLKPLGFKITQDESFGYEVNLAVEDEK